MYANHYNVSRNGPTCTFTLDNDRPRSDIPRKCMNHLKRLQVTLWWGHQLRCASADLSVSMSLLCPTEPVLNRQSSLQIIHASAYGVQSAFLHAVCRYRVESVMRENTPYLDRSIWWNDTVPAAIRRNPKRICVKCVELVYDDNWAFCTT